MADLHGRRRTGANRLSTAAPSGGSKLRQLYSNVVAAPAPDPPPTRQLVCPFSAHNPVQYGTSPGYQELACMNKGYSCMSKWREHIKRKHSRRLNCPTCGKRIESDQAAERFTKDRPHCEKVEMKTSLPEIMTWEQDEKYFKFDFRKKGQTAIDLETQHKIVCNALWPGFDMSARMYIDQVAGLFQQQPVTLEAQLSDSYFNNGQPETVNPQDTMITPLSGESLREALDGYRIPQPVNNGGWLQAIPSDPDSGYGGSDTQGGDNHRQPMLGSPPTQGQLAEEWSDEQWQQFLGDDMSDGHLDASFQSNEDFSVVLDRTME